MNTDKESNMNKDETEENETKEERDARIRQEAIAYAMAPETPAGTKKKRKRSNDRKKERKKTSAPAATTATTTPTMTPVVAKSKARKTSLEQTPNTLLFNRSHLPREMQLQLERAERQSYKDFRKSKAEPKNKPKYTPAKYNPSVHPNPHENSIINVNNTSSASPSSLSSSGSPLFSSPSTEATGSSASTSNYELSKLQQQMQDREKLNTNDFEDDDSNDEDEIALFTEAARMRDEKRFQTEDEAFPPTDRDEVLRFDTSFDYLKDITYDGTNPASLFKFKDGTEAEKRDINTYIPDDYEEKKPRSSETWGSFDQVDNPGGLWNSYAYTPSRTKSGNYIGHSLPSGAMPVPPTPGYEGAVRKYKECTVYYGGIDGTWAVDPTTDEHVRKGATRIDILPKERRGSLDREKLEKHGLNIDRLIKKDALFMLQLLVPLTDTKKEGGVEYDERMPYYSEVSRFSCLNLTKKCGSADTGRTPKMFFSREEIHFDAIIMANGLAGGEANIDKLWDEGDPKFNPDVKKCKLKPTRFVDVKSFRKYNDNDRDASKQGTPEYDPGNKFGLIWKVSIYNMNLFTKHAAKDVCVDETTCATACMSSGFTQDLNGMKKADIGIQSVLLCDVGTMYPRGVLHRNKSNPKYENYSQGPTELRLLVENVILPNMGPEPEKLWSEPPHIVHDNFFFQELSSRFLGENGFSETCTCPKDQLPFGIEHKYLHKERTSNKKNAKAARYLPPIVFVHEADGYRMVLFSFQSTGPTNIMCLNSVSDGSFYVRKKKRGRGDKRYVRLIEMNMGRDLYLICYGTIDKLDAVIAKCRLTFILWKYYHAPTCHGLAMVINTAWTMYRECISGDLGDDWKIPPKHAFKDFREFYIRLTKQMLEYDPVLNLYPGDSSIRLHTQTSKQKRSSLQSKHKKREKRRMEFDNEKYGCFNQLDRKTIEENIESGRLQTSIPGFTSHLMSKTNIRNDKDKKLARKCYNCGVDTTTYCGICKDQNGEPIPLCYFFTGKTCFADYHTLEHFGLCKNDFVYTSTYKGDWIAPSDEKKKLWAKYVKHCLECDPVCKEVTGSCSRITNNTSDYEGTRAPGMEEALRFVKEIPDIERESDEESNDDCTIKINNSSSTDNNSIEKTKSVDDLLGAIEGMTPDEIQEMIDQNASDEEDDTNSKNRNDGNDTNRNDSDSEDSDSNDSNSDNSDSKDSNSDDSNSDDRNSGGHDIHDHEINSIVANGIENV